MKRIATLIAVGTAGLAFAACGGSSSTQATATSSTPTAFDNALMARVEGQIKDRIRERVAQEGYEVRLTDSDCVADTARRFTCLSSTSVKGSDGLCYVLGSEQRGTVDPTGHFSWKSSATDNGVEGC